MAGTITIDVNDVYVLNYTGDQTDDWISTPYTAWGTQPSSFSAVRPSPHGSISGIVNIDTGITMDYTDQLGTIMHNLKIGSLAAWNCRTAP